MMTTTTLTSYPRGVSAPSRQVGITHGTFKPKVVHYWRKNGYPWLPPLESSLGPEADWQLSGRSCGKLTSSVSRS